MKNPCLIISTECPSIVFFTSEANARAAGELLTDPRWQIVDLEMVTVIWGDDEYSGAGVFNFTPITLTGSITEMRSFGTLARRQFYDENSLPIPLEEYLETPYTLITILPGRLDEIG